MKMNFELKASSFLLITGSLLLSSCEKDQLITPVSGKTVEMDIVHAPKPPKGTFFYGLSDANEIVGYTTGNPLAEQGSWSITGLAGGEEMLAIDFRPATGQLYGVSSMSRLYTINTSTGMATAVSGPFTPAINGDEVALDFNPTVDRIRLVTSSGQNLRLHPVTGMVVFVDGSINPGTPEVSAVGYTNSFAGSTMTTLYDIDTAADKLYKQVPPNSGTLVEVGPLGLLVTGEGGFDISPDNSVALAVLYGRGDDGEDQDEYSNGNKTRFYYIDLATGKATNAGKTHRNIIGLAIPPSL